MGTKVLYILMLWGCLAACTKTGTEEKDFDGPASRAYQNVVFLTENNVKQTISVFRQGESGFAFLKTIPVTGSRTEAQLPVGNYQFLFAGFYGENTLLNTPVPGTTLFPAMRFSVLPEDINPGYLRKGDELFLQDEKADKLYEILGPTTIKATLKRAVSRVVIYIKRGWAEDEIHYIPLPYQNDSIVRYFSNIRLDIGNVGTAVDALCVPEGQGKLSVTIPAGERDTLTSEGFAVYNGPFFFPAANGQAVDINLSLFRSADSPQPDLSLNCQATLERNQQLILNAWVTSDWNFIGITADTEPITRETEGEQDVWDDNVTIMRTENEK